MTKNRNISAIIMAAGLSRRMGRNKLLLKFKDQSLIAHTLALITTLPFYEVILVGSPSTIAYLQANGEIVDGVEVLVNHTPEGGQSTSLRMGTEAARGEAFMFFTADQPLLNEELIGHILAQDTPGHIVIPRTSHGPCSPVLFCASFRKELMAVTGDVGGRKVWQDHPERCLFVEVSNPVLLMDIDTPEQYRRLLAYDAESGDSAADTCGTIDSRQQTLE